MNRNKAKLLTATGILACLISLILFIYDVAGRESFQQFVSPIFCVGGIVLIIFSLAYYTEK
jgi:hypothetical protein